MDNSDKKRQLMEFIRLYNDADEICQSYAKANGLSETAFRILYSLVYSGKSYTQMEFCREWSYPRQTVNSALKILKEHGVIELKLSENSLKNKEIHLTEKGQRIADEIIRPFIKADLDAFSSLSDDECNFMLSAMRKYNRNLTAGLPGEPIRPPTE